jgi:hypothetical protein
MLTKKGLLLLIITFIFATNAFSSELDYISNCNFTYTGKLNNSQFQQFGNNTITDGYELARLNGFSAIRIDKLPKEISLFIEDELTSYDLEANDVFIFSVQSSRSLISGVLKIVRKLTGLSYEFYAVHIR